MRNDEGIANFIQAHLFGGGCAPDTAVTEVAHRPGGDRADSTVEDISRVVQHCRGQNGQSTGCFTKKGTNEEVCIEEVKDTTVHEEALEPTTCPAWTKARAFCQTGKDRSWQTGAQEGAHEERWNRCRCWKEDWQRKDWSGQEGTRGDWVLSFSAEAQDALGAKESVLTSGSKRPAEEPGVALTVTRYPTPSECREHGRREGTNDVG